LVLVHAVIDVNLDNSSVGLHHLVPAPLQGRFSLLLFSNFVLRLLKPVKLQLQLLLLEDDLLALEVQLLSLDVLLLFHQLELLVAVVGGDIELDQSVGLGLVVYEVGQFVWVMPGGNF
jgi:hypothetical protein